MNKEYMYISNEEIVITSEDGKLQKRNVEASDMRQLLQTENNLESINVLIDDLESSIYEKEKTKNTFFSYNRALIISAYGMAITGGLMLSVAIFPLGGIPFSICTFIVTEAIFLLPCIRRIRKEKIQEQERINGLAKELEQAYELKESYEKEIELLKSKKNEDRKEQDTTQIISLEDSMTLTTEDSKKLDAAYQEGYHSKPNQFVLRKQNKINQEN